MRRYLLILMALGVLGTALGAQTLDFPQPQYVNPIFDSFTRNYMSTSAMGRGYTGLAIPGGVDNVLLNPAGHLPDKAALHLELLVKPPVDSDMYAMADTSVFYQMSPQVMTSPVPVGVVGGGGRIGPNFTFGLLYSMPKAIKGPVSSTQPICSLTTRITSPVLCPPAPDMPSTMKKRTFCDATAAMMIKTSTIAFSARTTVAASRTAIYSHT